MQNFTRWRPTHSVLTAQDRLNALDNAERFVGIELDKTQVDQLEASAVLTVYEWILRIDRNLWFVLDE